MVTFIEYLHMHFPGLSSDEVQRVIDKWTQEDSIVGDTPTNGGVQEEAALLNVEEIARVFDLYDKNKDGYITLQELTDGIGASGLDEMGEVFAEHDMNGDQLLSIDEFYMLMTVKLNSD
eukprot:TRINITY_DN63690_c0_g2_i2.p2 TRINITY_DN63690_c0_g2~~TRINITY_DN63690_c0_g2_i2.p2  ORF type:complete len:119 (+),score=29.92 TRINITY_DN63690_c0_g2_i2:755-1111(+)